MTAPALPREDQAAEQAYDLTLDALMDGDVRCQGCDAPATHALVHGASCRVFMCDEHTKAQRAFIAAHAPTSAARCKACGVTNLTLSDFTVRAI